MKGSLNCTTAVMDINHLKITGKRKRKTNFRYQLVNTGDLSIAIRRVCGFVQLSKENYIKCNGVKRFKKSNKDVKMSKLI